MISASAHKIVFGLIAALAVGGWCLTGAPVASVESKKPGAAVAPPSTNLAESFIVTVWKTGDGLPANEILDLQETPDGYLWMGTFQGLVRFDGVRFDTFFNIPTGARYATRIEPLEVDDRGRLWFAPDQTGLICLEKGIFTEVLTNRAILKERVRSLRRDGANGLLWVDDRGGLGRFPAGQSEQAQVIKGAGSASSRWWRDFDGHLWLASARSLKIYEGGQWRDVAVPGTANLEAAPRRAGGLWIAREARLKFVTASGETQEVAVFPWVGQSRVTCLWEDQGRRLWIGTVDAGLYCYADGEFTQVIPGGSVACLLEDAQGNLWAGTRGGGLVRVRARQFFMHDLRHGLDNETVRSLAQDPAGRIWMTTAEGGLGWRQNGVWQALGPHGWPGHDSLCLWPTRDGDVWISTVRRGLWRWSEGKFSRHHFGPNALRGPVVDLLEDRQKRLWMVTDNSGVFCLETNRLTAYTVKEGLPSGYIRRLAEDESGEIWAGDWEGALACWRNRRWETVRPASGHRDAVRSMVVAQGAVWMGTSSGGLLRWKEGKTARVTPEHGLPDVAILQLLFDERSSLWGATSHRLFQISLASLNDVMAGRRKNLETTTYGRSDGLPDTSFAAWNDPRCWRAVDGELWFATANGALHFHPEKLPTNPPPQIFLEPVLLDGKPMTTAALQQLRPGPGRVEFRFTAPCLSAPERVRFRYQLTGVDPGWVEAGTARTATYASIPPGQHEFRVMASSPEGIWSSSSASMALAVHPHFWQTSWFLAGAAATLAGGCVWLARRATVRRLNRRLERMRQQQALEHERARIAQDLHDELGANLTSIGLMADMGKRHQRDLSTTTREFEQISQTARESVSALDAIVWALNPQHDSLDHFANYLAQFMREFFRPTTLRIRLDLPTDLPSHSLSTEARHQLFLMVKESFHNIVRHAQASEASLQLACRGADLQLWIADNGQGLPAHAPATGSDGLHNLRERVAQLSGTLRIESQPGLGTKLEFVVPLAKLKTN